MTWRNGLRHFAPVAVVGLLGILVSLTMWSLTASSEDRTFSQEFAGRAANQAVHLQTGINVYWGRLSAVRALFDSSSEVSRDEFELFADSLLEGYPAILNIAWLPRVKREERAAHEFAARRDGIPDYHIREVPPDGSLPISAERDEYFPKYYSTETRTSPVYGLDNNDGGAREKALSRIRDNDALSVSPPLMLHIGNGDRRGFWAGLPVYERDLPHETVEQRQKNIRGFVQGVFQTDVMIKTITTGFHEPLRVFLFAPGATSTETSTHASSLLDLTNIEGKSQAELATGLHRAYPLNFGDVPWTMVFAPETTLPAGLLSPRHQLSTIVLLSGLLLSAALSCFIWIMRRYTRNIETAHNLYEIQNAQFDAALSNMGQGLLMYDAAGKLTISNRRVAELFGLPWDRWRETSAGLTVTQTLWLGHELADVKQKSHTQLIADLQRILDDGRPGTLLFERANGRTVSALCAPMSDGGFVVTLDDITERRRSEKEISHMAHHDGLTNLPNRIRFYERMDEILKGNGQAGSFAILSLDLDRFKLVNDTLGHPAGDKLLHAVAGRLRGAIRHDDMAARLGGDEFVILQHPFIGSDDVIALAKRLIRAVTAPYQIDGHQINIGASIGIAVSPADGIDAQKLIKRADLALYRSKRDGGGGYVFYDSVLDVDSSPPDMSFIRVSPSTVPGWGNELESADTIIDADHRAISSAARPPRQ